MLLSFVPKHWACVWIFNTPRLELPSILCYGWTRCCRQRFGASGFITERSTCGRRFFRQVRSRRAKSTRKLLARERKGILRVQRFTVSLAFLFIFFSVDTWFGVDICLKVCLRCGLRSQICLTAEVRRSDTFIPRRNIVYFKILSGCR